MTATHHMTFNALHHAREYVCAPWGELKLAQETVEPGSIIEMSINTTLEAIAEFRQVITENMSRSGADIPIRKSWFHIVDMAANRAGDAWETRRQAGDEFTGGYHCLNEISRNLHALRMAIVEFDDR